MPFLHEPPPLLPLSACTQLLSLEVASIYAAVFCELLRSLRAIKRAAPLRPRPPPPSPPRAPVALPRSGEHLRRLILRAVTLASSNKKGAPSGDAPPSLFR